MGHLSDLFASWAYPPKKKYGQIYEINEETEQSYAEVISYVNMVLKN